MLRCITLQQFRATNKSFLRLKIHAAHGIKTVSPAKAARGLSNPVACDLLYI